MKCTRWFMMMLVFFGIIICYMDRSALAYAIKPLEQTFHLNNEQFGLLSSVFAIGYLFMVFIGGVIVDRWGSHLIWTLSALIWSLVTIALGLSTGLVMLLILRFMLGLAEGPAFPALTRATTNWLPVKERNRALAIGLAAVPFASVIGAPLSTYLIREYGWREMFIVLGSFGVLWSVVWFVIFREYPKQSHWVSSQELAYIEKEQFIEADLLRTEKKSTWAFILTNKTFLINNYAFFAFGYLLFFGITWLPGYLEQTFHLGIKEVGLFLILPWLLSTIALLFNGWFSDWLWNKTHSLRISRSYIIGICMILSAFCFLPAILSHNLTTSVIFISFAIALGLLPNSCFFSLNADLTPDRAATSMGIMDVALSLAGILAPLITGYLSNLTGNFSVAIEVMFILNVSAGVLVLFFQNPDATLLKKNGVH